MTFFILIPLFIATPVLFIYFTEPKKENYIMYLITSLVVVSYTILYVDFQLDSKLDAILQGFAFGLFSLFFSLLSLLKKSWTFGKTFYNSNKVFLILYTIGWVMKLLGM
jgi:hypothetical protein